MHGVVDVAEAAGLVAISEHRQVLSAESLPDEPRYHHAVGAGLPGPRAVEQPDDDRGSSSLSVELVGEDLVHHLRGGVGPPRLRRWAEDPVGVLGQPVGGILPVDLRCGCDEGHRPVAGTRLQDGLGPQDVVLDRRERVVHDQLDPDRGGEMYDGVAPGDQSIGDIGIERSPTDQLE